MARTRRICNQCGEEKYTDDDPLKSDFTLDKRVGLFWHKCKACDSKNRVKRDQIKRSMMDKVPKLERTRKETIADAINTLCNISHHDPKKMTSHGQNNGEYFLNRFSSLADDLEKYKVPFSLIYKKAINKLHKMLGITYPRDVQLGDGLYLVIGDSYGKEMKTATFNLIKNMQKFYNFKNIIHIGHMLDEEDDYSWWFDRIPEICNNLIVLARPEEIRVLAEKNMCNSIKFNIVRESLWLGNLKLMNQDNFNITRYTTSGIKNANPSIYTNHTMFDDVKHEMHSVTTPENRHRLFMSPGCMCIPFTKMTKVTTESPENGERIIRKRTVFADTHQMNRHRNQMKEFWEQGCYIIAVVNGRFTPYPLRIHTLEWEYVSDDDSQHPRNQAVGLFGTVITSNGVERADSTSLVVGDSQAPLHDPKVLSCIDRLAKMVKFDYFIHIGDLCAFNSVNHHNISKGKYEKYVNEDFLYDVGISGYLLERMKGWAPKRYLMSANHERFVRDFYEHNPQFKSLMDIKRLFRLDELGYEMVDYQMDKNIDGCTYHHGNLKAYGCSGNVHEKIAKVFEGRNMQVFIGHIHYPAIRYGCYSVGLTGLLDQEFNEVNASQWIHGVGSSTSYHGQSWNTTIPIMFDSIILPMSKPRILTPVDDKFEAPDVLNYTLNLKCRRKPCAQF